MIYKSDLISKLLKEPFENGNDELIIISGYGSSKFLDDIITKLPDIKITLVLGMASQGIPKIDYELYKEICERDNNIVVKFQLESPPTHMKIYQWLRDGNPTECFIGSANFSYSGFVNNNEIMTLVNQDCMDLIKEFIDKSVYCLSEDLLTDNLLLFSSKIPLQEQTENESKLSNINRDFITNHQLKRYEYDEEYTEVALIFSNGLNRGLRNRNNSYLDIDKNLTFFDKCLPIGEEGTMEIDELRLKVIRSGQFGRQLHVLHDYYDFYSILLSTLSLDSDDVIDYAALRRMNLETIKFKYIERGLISLQL